MDVDQASQAGGTPVIIYACHGGANQKWDIPASGTTGTIKVYGSMCLDAAGGQGNDSDQIIIWACHGGLNQQWTFTTAGELKGGAGKCIEVGGTGIANGDNLFLEPCNGSAPQKWDPPGIGAAINQRSGPLYGSATFRSERRLQSLSQQQSSQVRVRDQDI